MIFPDLNLNYIHVYVYFSSVIVSFEINCPLFIFFFSVFFNARTFMVGRKNKSLIFFRIFRYAKKQRYRQESTVVSLYEERSSVNRNRKRMGKWRNDIASPRALELQKRIILDDRASSWSLFRKKKNAGSRARTSGRHKTSSTEWLVVGSKKKTGQSHGERSAV